MWQEYYVYSAEFLPLAAGTLNGLSSVQAFSPFDIRIATDSDFVFQKTIYQATDPRVYVKYRDDSSSRYLHRGSLDLRAFGGNASTALTPFFLGPGAPGASGFFPFTWPLPYIIAAGTIFSTEAADFSGAANTVRIAFHGSKQRPGNPPWQQKYREIPHTYPVEPALIAANATVTASLSTDIDSDFMIHALVATRTGNAMVTIQEGGRDRQWMDRAVPIDLLFGNAQFPNLLSSPRFLYRGTVVSFTIQDLTGLVAGNLVKLFLVGSKLYA